MTTSYVQEDRRREAYTVIADPVPKVFFYSLGGCCVPTQLVNRSIFSTVQFLDRFSSTSFFRRGAAGCTAFKHSKGVGVC